jgi:hypothetical protein
MLTTSQMRRFRQLLASAAADGHKALHCQPNIPASKLRNALEGCGLPPDIEVLALIDFTVFGSAKEALLFCVDGLHYRWLQALKPRSIPYIEFRDLTVSLRMGVVNIGPDHSFAGDHALVQLLSSLQPLLAETTDSVGDASTQVAAAEDLEPAKPRGGLGLLPMMVVAGLAFFFLRDLFEGRESPIFLFGALAIAVLAIAVFGKLFRK